MIRDSKGTKKYWDKWTNKLSAYIEEHRVLIREPSKNPKYRPQFVFELVNEYLHLMLRRYSRGDSINELKQYFPPLLDYWEKSEELGKDIWDKEEKQLHYYGVAWCVNLNVYIKCFWLVGLALVLDIPEDQWQRLLKLIGNEGEDEILDRIIASRQSGRKIGSKICHPKPYQLLLDTVNAPKEKQARMLYGFVSKWYEELKPRPRKYLPKGMPRSPYWYNYGNNNFDGGAYFGRWCIEAVAAVKAFGLDDSKCLGHEHYPGDLLRPNGPSTHSVREEVTYLKTSDEKLIKNKPGFLARLFGKKH